MGSRRLRHFTGLRRVEPSTLSGLLQQAVQFRQEVREGQNGVLRLRGRAVALLFVEPSTRTRFSFEMACVRLGARVLVFDPDRSSSKKGESLLDTARVLQAVGAEAVVVRHKTVGAPHLLSQFLGVPVINAGDGIHEHPTQALLDLMTLQDRFADLSSVHVGIVGDVLHSRVARSNILGLRALGARVSVCGPRTLCSADMATLGAEVVDDIDALLPELDAVMMLRIQRERLGGSSVASESEYRRFWGLTEARANLLPEHGVVLHPAPMNRGVEIDDGVADGPRSVIFDQMENGVFARMAVLNHCMEGEPCE